MTKEISQNIVTINSRKFDGQIHRSWRAELISETTSLLTFVGEFEKEVVHPSLGVIRRKTMSFEFYWLNLWFNVFRFHEPDGELRNFYCNVNMPPRFVNRTLDYVDLDLDILVWKDFSYEILDVEEFRENSEKYQYDEITINEAEKSLERLKVMIEKKIFPFDYQQ